MNRIDELLQERERLQKRLAWLGVRSDGSERLERRIKEIDAEIERLRQTAS